MSVYAYLCNNRLEVNGDNLRLLELHKLIKRHIISGTRAYLIANPLVCTPEIDPMEITDEELESEYPSLTIKVIVIRRGQRELMRYAVILGLHYTENTTGNTQENNHKITLTFLTKLEPPLAWVSDLAAGFPDLKFVLYYCEPVKGIAGTHTWRQGEYAGETPVPLTGDERMDMLIYQTYAGFDLSGRMFSRVRKDSPARILQNMGVDPSPERQAVFILSEMFFTYLLCLTALWKGEDSLSFPEYTFETDMENISSFSPAGMMCSLVYTRVKHLVTSILLPLARTDYDNLYIIMTAAASEVLHYLSCMKHQYGFTQAKLVRLIEHRWKGLKLPKKVSNLAKEALAAALLIYKEDERY